MRATARFVAVLMLGVVVAACSGAATGAPAASAPPDAPRIGAAQMAFDRSELTLPANRAVSLVFENRESAPHNVSVQPQGGGQPAFVGEVFSGPATRVYQVPPLGPGTYLFRCDVHPEMQGVLTAR